MTYFWDLLSEYGASQCLHCDGDEISYGELERLSDDLFGTCDRGVAVILCNYNVETIAGYIGALRNRLVPLMLPGDVAQVAFEEYLAAYRPRYVWLDAARAAVIKERLAARSIAGHLSYELLEFSRLGDAPELHPDLALLMPTSGSTGDPKLVRISRGNIQSNAVSISRYLGIDDKDVAITNLPLN